MFKRTVSKSHFSKFRFETLTLFMPEKRDGIMNLALYTMLPQDDVSLSGYKKYLMAQAAPLPLTAAEEELRQIKLSEVHTTRIGQ